MVPKPFDLSYIFHLVITGIVLLFTQILGRFAGADTMSVGGLAGDRCAVCAKSSSKKCSKCKKVHYCSEACQAKHWAEGHKFECKQDGPKRRKTSAFGPISLVPRGGKCNVLQLQEPKRILFPYDEFVKLFNCTYSGYAPCGLLNSGNSCFANAVLQCLTYTPPLAAYLLEKDHRTGCIRKQKGFCFLCELQVHVQRYFNGNELYAYAPDNIISQLPNIGGDLRCGSQEDAHEFMRFAIDTMQSACLDEFGGEKALDPSTQETTIIQQIFGGRLQSQVTCTKCNAISNRYENMMDLTVEIHGEVESLEECLKQFTVKEWLDGDNMYKCDGCNEYVEAWKRLTVHQAPNILTVALKRFETGQFGKLNKRVTFPMHLNLAPYMSGEDDGTDLYSLYGVVVHLDMLNSSYFGHYICYLKDFDGLWYRIDDSQVRNAEVYEVCLQRAYMLLYRRKTPRRQPCIKPSEPANNNNKQAFMCETDSITTKVAASCGFLASLLSDDSMQSKLSSRDIELLTETSRKIDAFCRKRKICAQSVIATEHEDCNSVSDQNGCIKENPGSISSTIHNEQTDNVMSRSNLSVASDAVTKDSESAMSASTSYSNGICNMSDICESKVLKSSSSIKKTEQGLFSRGFLDKPKPVGKLDLNGHSQLDSDTDSRCTKSTSDTKNDNVGENGSGMGSLTSGFLTRHYEGNMKSQRPDTENSCSNAYVKDVSSALKMKSKHNGGGSNSKLKSL